MSENEPDTVDHSVEHEAPDPEILRRFNRWIGWAVGIAVLLFGGYAVWTGWADTADQLWGFRWSLAVPVLALTLVNYGLRYLKWTYLLKQVGVVIPHKTNLGVFATGLAMVISPGKAGELVKPYLVRTITGASMTRTVPALVTERLTDGIAVVILAAVGVSTYLADSATLIAATLAATAAGLLVLSVESLSLTLISWIGRLPVLGRVAPRLEEAYRAMRTCVAPIPLLVTLAMSLVAWWAECVGYWLIFDGLGVTASLDASTFIYAFSTVFGAPSPGGLGMADAALVQTSQLIIPDLSKATALTAALLVRLATLWFGVLIGAIAMIRVERIIDAGRASMNSKT